MPSDADTESSFELQVEYADGTTTRLEIDSPSTLTVRDVKAALYSPTGGLGPDQMWVTDVQGQLLSDDQTVAGAHLDALNNRVRLGTTGDRRRAPASTTAEFVGYLVLSLVLLVLFFVFISYSESAYDAIERSVTRYSRRQWRAGRPSVLVELVIFFGVLLFFGVLMWQLAVQGSSNDAANTYGSSPVYPNPDDPLSPEHVDVPKERKKKMTTKERVLAVVGVVVLVLLVALVAYALRSKWVQGKIQDLRDHTSNRFNRQRADSRRQETGASSAASDADDDWLSS